jgi:hypothetical protein
MPSARADHTDQQLPAALPGQSHPPARVSAIVDIVSSNNQVNVPVTCLLTKSLK